MKQVEVTFEPEDFNWNDTGFRITRFTNTLKLIHDGHIFRVGEWVSTSAAEKLLTMPDVIIHVQPQSKGRLVP